MTDKYFINTDKTERHAIDEDFVHLVPTDLIEITKEDYDELGTESNKKTDEHKLAGFKVDVLAALDASDLVALHVYKSGEAFGAEWVLYDTNLR